jgi:hypothetical protein
MPWDGLVSKTAFAWRTEQRRGNADCQIDRPDSLWVGGAGASPGVKGLAEIAGSKGDNMKYRALSLCLTVVALGLFATAIRAEEKHGKACTGTIVSVDATGEKLVVKEAESGTTTNNPGSQQQMEKTFTLSSNSKIMCDGKTCQLTDLKPGQKVRVWTKTSDPTAVVRVEALDKNTDFSTVGGGK